MMKIRRRFIKEKEGKKLLLEFFKRTKIQSQPLPQLKPPIELVKTNNEEIFFISREPIFAKSNNLLFPTLASHEFLSTMPKAIVNMGTVPHVCNGADVMAPGVVRFEGKFNREDLVIVCDERHQRPITITTALYTTKEAKKLKHGKILKNVHYIGDKIWNLTQKLTQKTKATKSAT